MLKKLTEAEWRLKLIVEPPEAAKIFTPEEWERIVREELSYAPIGWKGEDNPNAGGHPQTLETRHKISINNARHWLGKTGTDHPSTGRSRPDSVEIARRMGEGNRGKPSWNSGKTGVQCHSTETRKKMSESHVGRKKPIVICPHCSKSGGEGAMIRWHFDNCKEKKSCA
jgi:hypothetical protein